MLPDESRCVLRLAYAEQKDGKFYCKTGLEFVNGACVLSPDFDWKEL